MEGTEKQNGFIGKKIAIFYDDGGHVSRKDGTCTNNSDSEIELDNRIIIQKGRVVRIEVGE